MKRYRGNEIGALLKSLIAMTVIVVTALSLIGCGNKTFLDTTYTFGYAMVKLQDGTVVQGEVESWTDFEDGDQVQIKIRGNTYLVHTSNATLMVKKPEELK